MLHLPALSAATMLPNTSVLAGRKWPWVAFENEKSRVPRSICNFLFPNMVSRLCGFRYAFYFLLDCSWSLIVKKAARMAAHPPSLMTQLVLVSQGCPRGFCSALKMTLPIALEIIWGKEIATLCRPRTTPAWFVDFCAVLLGSSIS